MKKIKLDSRSLVAVIFENKRKIGSSDWDIYFNERGKFDVLHNTHQIRDGWYFFTSFYDWYPFEDIPAANEKEKYRQWIISDDVISLHTIENNINEFIYGEPDDKLSLTWLK